MVMQNAIESTMPGRIPEVNRSPIDTLAMTPKMMKRMLGGISIPSTELPATTPTENPVVWPWRTISGTAILVKIDAEAIEVPVQAANTALAPTVAMARPPRRRFNSSAATSNVSRPIAGGRDEQPHEDEQGNDGVGIGGNGGCGGPGKQLARDFHALHREYAGERQEHQRHSDMHSGLNQNDAAQHGQRANHDVTHSGGLPCPNACANSWPANKTY